MDEDPLKTLNQEQLDAVTHTEGPLLVIAGAGTGKTLVVTHRIAHLIRQGVKPERILALTFTEKAASEMEERVDRLTPYGYTNVCISTFHSFGDRVLRDHGLKIGLTTDFKVLSDPERVIFLQEHLFELPLSYFRPLGNPTRYIRGILNLISRAKDEEITPEDYIRFVDGLEDGLKDGDKELEDYIAQQKELSLTYKRYEGLMSEHGFIDFGDQVMLPLRLFREKPSVLREYQEVFDYILVDEFQDTNYAQFQLVKMLADRHRNITCVGDDDQSIYKFRGAAISNILNFKDTYPDAKEVVLKKNYRTTQGILDAAYTLISHNNPDRLEYKEGVDKRLESIRGFGSSEIINLTFDTLSSEAEGVAERILKEREADRRSFRDFAILVRANNDAEPFLRALKEKGIPFRFSGSRGLYSREEIRVLLAFLRVIVDYTDNLSLYNLASSDIYGLKACDLIPCHTISSKMNTPLFYTMKAVVDRDERIVSTLPLTTEGVATISKLIRDIEIYSERGLKERVGELLYSYIKDTGYLQRLVEDNSFEGVERVQNIARFFEIIFHLENSLNIDRAHLFVRHIDTMMEAGDDPPVAEVDVDDDVVNVMTVHKAKGLEFPVVFMVGLVSDRFPRRERRDPIELPTELVRDILPQGNFHLQEERRLFYVGMTRAKERLYLTSARDYGGVRAKKVSQFVLEALNLSKDRQEVIKSGYIESIERFASVDRSRTISKGKTEGTITLTPYQIDDYTTCPLKYKYIHILRIPVLPHHSVIYGKAIHEAISWYFRNKQKGRMIPFEEVSERFRASWRSEGFITKEHEDLRFEAGIDALKRFYERDRLDGISPSAVERDFLVDMGEFRLKGRWDIIEERDDGPVIIDFKTSDVQEQKKADKATKESIQLSLYALSYRGLFGRMVAGLELHFVESGLVGRTDPDEKTIEKALKSINQVLEGLRAEDFSPKPDFLNCRYCYFNTICPGSATK